MTNMASLDYTTIQIYKSIRVLVLFAMTWANDNGPKEYNKKKLGLSCAMSIAHAGAARGGIHPPLLIFQNALKNAICGSRYCLTFNVCPFRSF